MGRDGDDDGNNWELAWIGMASMCARKKSEYDYDLGCEDEEFSAAYIHVHETRDVIRRARVVRGFYLMVVLAST